MVQLNCNHVLNSLPNVTLDDIFHLIMKSPTRDEIENQYHPLKSIDIIETISLKVRFPNSEDENKIIEVTLPEDNNFKVGYEIRPYFRYINPNDDNTLSATERLKFMGFYYYDNTEKVKLNIDDLYYHNISRELYKEMTYNVLNNTIEHNQHIKKSSDNWLFYHDIKQFCGLYGSIERVELDGDIYIFIKRFNKNNPIFKVTPIIKPVIRQDYDWSLNFERWDLEIKE